jgi:formate dehydrogenase subunit gamma
VRFTGAVRAAHWINAVLFGLLVATGAALYGAPGTQWVGHRDIVRTVHLWAGLVLFVPLIVAYACSPALRDDVRRLARWTPDDLRWWSRWSRPHVRLGKFNPGQKLNATFTFAALLVLFLTGLMLHWYEPFPDDWRTGATFVHDSTALVLGLVVVGHIGLALSDRDALRGMVRGRVRAEWARTERPRWHAEIDPDAEPADRNDPVDVAAPR